MTDQSAKTAKRYLDYFKTIPKNEWHQISKYAPENPIKFVHHLKMLGAGCCAIDGSKFKIKTEL